MRVEQGQTEDCLHEELEHGVCADCGAECDWIDRTFRDVDYD